MLKRVVLAMALAALAAAPVQAASYANPDDCLQAAFDYAKGAEAKNLSNEVLDDLEELLVKMENHCDQNQLAEAAVVGKEIEKLVGN
ncbi:MAG: hypothetical protein NW205_13095 [Hyphomicrobiaceae bacterium]|nr:hypothetical protein [Hyphomicrobiaceae bacterium]